MFLLFTGNQYSRRDKFAGWTGSFTELDAGLALSLQVGFASTAALGLSFLLAQIDMSVLCTWPTAFEFALCFFTALAYILLYYRDRWEYVFGWCIFSFLVFLYVFLMGVRAVKRYQGRKYKSFVLSQAARVGINTMIQACVTTYALTAMLRVPIEGTLLNVFVELSLNGIACADQAAFVSAFEASAANASCPAVPNCGYATYEGLCQAVQYAPMVRAVKEDLIDVNLFILFSWVTISILILGTGRARANDDGYSHLLSRHMLVAMVLGLVSLILTLFSFMRLLLIGLRLSAPRPAAYFDQTDLMKTYELPLFCYGECGAIRFWVKLVLYLLILFALKIDFLAKYASRLRDPNEVQKEQLEKAIKELRREGWDNDEPSFYFIPAEWVRVCSTNSLPRMQTLRDDGHLTKIQIPLASAFREPAFCGGGIMANILSVSHRWEAPDQPDLNGEQLKAIKAYLEEHPDIKWVWYQYSSMPQGIDGIDDRTPMEKAEFQLMLAAIADLYLTAHVLILLDTSYAYRFWTLMEAWCSMQTVTPEGLRPATEAERRYTISCIHNATDEHDAKGLVEKVSQKTPEAIYRILEKPDVIGNVYDKANMLPQIGRTNEHVIDTFQRYIPMELVDQAIKELRREGWDDDAPSFYFIPAEWVRVCSTNSLPRMQTLRDDGHLTKIQIPLASAFREPAFCGGGIMANILSVSHRWEAPDQPDLNGEQLKAIKAYLEEHPDIKWVWYQYSSMPQGIDGIDDRTPMEKAEFQLMLAAIADLYLTAHVLILLDTSYAYWFWTLTEAWCSMQTVTPDGLRPATEAERRYTISCIHNATDEHDAKGLVDLVSKKTPEAMHGILKKPDVNVTNAKDKQTMLPVILKTNEHVIETFEKYFPMERITEKLRKQGWDDDAPSFYFIPAEWVRECSTKSLPRMQTLRDGRHLTKIKIPLASAFRAPAFRGGGITANILFVSHRWEEPDQPDVDGEQLKAIKAYLEAHPDIEWVWFDYSSMPQGDDRTVMEKAEFDLMLAAIADLYLTAHVLILLDGSYASRFWTLMEAWCSMQTVTPDGLRPATEAERRYTISCIHNATDEHDAKGLVDLVSKKTPEAMHGILKKPDVNVTNAKDKQTMLPVILKTNEHVVETFQKLDMLPEPKPAVATAASSPVPGLGQRYAIGSCVFLKRSNGEETLAYVNTYNAEEVLYTVEIDTLGSGKTEKCHDKDLRAATVLEGLIGSAEGLIGSARASLLAFKADDSDLLHA